MKKVDFRLTLTSTSACFLVPLREGKLVPYSDWLFRRPWESHFGAAELRCHAFLGQEENILAGCSNSSSSKAAASEDLKAYPLGYVEGLNDARTLLADCFSILRDGRM